MSDFQSQKQTVLEYYSALDAAQGDDLIDVMTQHTAPDYIWRGYHPFHLKTDAEQVARDFWQPLKHALRPMQRRMDVFFAGANHMDDANSVWVCSMGHLMGLFDHPWLGIPATQKMAMLRYCEFHRVENGKICETAMYFDIPHLMMQTGLSPFGPQTAAHMVQPGPQSHDALLFNHQDPAAGIKTMAAINFMIADLGQWNSGLKLEDELARSWHDDMIWWGPAGIGASYTIERYAKQHSGPFRAAFSERSKTNHIARIAEGQYSGFFGWPNFQARLTGPFMGREPTDKVAEFRVIDIYRRSGDKLMENWIFIDLLHFWNQQGWDVLGELSA
ncbi:MAG: ester cyclase [Planktomarina sp.]